MTEDSTAWKPDWGVAAVLAGASAAHLAAVALPFVAMRTLLSTDVYGLLSSVRMLWSFGLYWLAFLVVAFSIVFPFAKLLILWQCWATREASPRLLRLLKVAEAAGKWSMFDIFLIVLLLVVTSDCVLVATRPLVGALCFLAGVCCTLVGGQRISRTIRPVEATPAGTPVPSGRKHLLMGLAALTLVVAQLAPVMETDSLLVKDRTFSVLEMALALTRSGMSVAAISVALFLIALPWAALVAQWGASSRRFGPRCRAITNVLRHWVMLDVFAVALVLFLVESQSTVPTRPAFGAAVLSAAVLLHALALRAARWR